MDTDTQDLIEELTTELEHCEGMITRLYVRLADADLVDESLADDVHRRQRSIREAVRKVRGSNWHNL